MPTHESTASAVRPTRDPLAVIPYHVTLDIIGWLAVGTAAWFFYRALSALRARWSYAPYVSRTRIVVLLLLGALALFTGGAFLGLLARG